VCGQVVGVAVDGVRGARGDHVGCLVATGDRDDLGTARRGKLDQRQADTTRCAGDHEGLSFCDAGAFQHAHRGAIGHRKGGQLLVGQRGSGHVVDLFGADDDELREAAVGLAAEQADGRCVTRLVAIQRRIHQYSLAHLIGIDASAHGGDHSRDVAALNPRKRDGPTPARPCVRVAGEALTSIHRFSAQLIGV